jgi:hypothetical protein
MGFGAPLKVWIMGHCNVMAFNLEQGAWTAKTYYKELWVIRTMGY